MRRLSTVLQFAVRDLSAKHKWPLLATMTALMACAGLSACGSNAGPVSEQESLPPASGWQTSIDREVAEVTALAAWGSSAYVLGTGPLIEQNDPVLLKLDSGGKRQWAWHAPSTLYSGLLRPIAVGAFDAVTLMATSTDAPGTVQLRRFSSTGKGVWRRAISDTGASSSNSYFMVAAPDGGLFVGRVNERGNDELLMLVRLDADASPAWALGLDSPGIGSFSGNVSACLDSSGNLYITTGRDEACICSFEPNGALRWAGILTVPDTERFHIQDSIVFSAASPQLYVCGYEEYTFSHSDIGGGLYQPLAFSISKDGTALWALKGRIPDDELSVLGSLYHCAVQRGAVGFLGNQEVWHDWPTPTEFSATLMRVQADGSLIDYQSLGPLSSRGYYPAAPASAEFLCVAGNNSRISQLGTMGGAPGQSIAAKIDRVAFEWERLDLARGIVATPFEAKLTSLPLDGELVTADHSEPDPPVQASSVAARLFKLPRL
ncbi:hypothetical protein IT575_13875 [bacterium]|nr:hypothetical protein [bacterium]